MNRQNLEEAQRFLKSLRALSGTRAIIAGGFVRDNVLGQPFRDIDLYVPEEQFIGVHHELTGEYPDYEAMYVDEASTEYVHQSIRQQVEFDPLPVVQARFPRIFTGHPINLIGIKDTGTVEGPDIVSRFNFGICQAWLSEDASGMTPEFRHDAKNKVITLLRLDWGREGSMRQYEKLHQKYPWPLQEDTPDETFPSVL